jgi:hypothetical protein
MPIARCPICVSIFAVVTAAVMACAAVGSSPSGDMIELTLKGRRIEGTAVAWSETDVHLLGRDGRLWEVAPNEATDFKKTSSLFHGYSPSEFRAVLLREFGNTYEVSGTGHYVVIHPKDQRDKWAQRFEDLYRSFVHYFSVRGLQPATPPFPLVGIVCRNQAEFARATAKAKGSPAPNGVLGYYDPETNQITLYDMGGHSEADWQENAAVIIHEATHQIAFNTGIHSRYCPPPKLLGEGLATLFEAPGVYDPHNHTQPADRVNRGRLKAFQRDVAPRHRPEWLAAIVASDEMFRVDPHVAYAEAWALSYFLVETEPRKYVEYLRRTAARPPFQDYTASQRKADFTAIFGCDWRMLEAKFLRFMGGVK